MLKTSARSTAAGRHGRYLATLLVLVFATACSGGAAPAATVPPSIPTAAAPPKADTSAPAPTAVSAPPAAAKPAAASTTDIAALAAAAKAEGGVKYFTPVLDQTLPSVFETFTAQYGVPVTMLQLTAAPLVERFYADLQRGDPPDVISLSDPGTFKQLIDQGYIEPYTPVAVATEYSTDRNGKPALGRIDQRRQPGLPLQHQPRHSGRWPEAA